MAIDPGRLEYGWLDRPVYEEKYLLSTAGYVEKLIVEQEDDRDAVFFTLAIHYWPHEVHHLTCRIYLDRNGAVAMAQLQLLRDAMESLGASGNKYPWVVVVHFNFTTENNWYRAQVYYVELRMPPDGVEYPVRTGDIWEINEWCLHEE